MKLFQLMFLLMFMAACGRNKKANADANFDRYVKIVEAQEEAATSSSQPVTNPHEHAGRPVENQKTDISVPKSSSELTIAQIYAHPEALADKELVIKGLVTKVNKNIMGKNWIHIQDGTEHNNSFDLTITSSQSPEINHIVSFKGKLHLNKDFGSGYFYPVIIEDAICE